MNEIIKIPPWTMKEMKIENSLTKYPKSTTPQNKYLEKYKEICTKYQNYYKIYTDGSKTNKHTGIGILTEDSEISIRIEDGQSIYNTEFHAINTAIKIANTKNMDTIIFTDSQSSVKSINKYNPKNKIIENIQLMVHGTNNKIILCWIPSHIGIQGNENADRFAKEAEGKIIDKGYKMQMSDHIEVLKQQINKIWQQEWERNGINKLAKIKKKVNEWDEIHLLDSTQDMICIY